MALGLGAGHGRDALFFAHEGFTVHATDFSATAPEKLTAAAHKPGLTDRITTTVHDVRDPLPLPDASVAPEPGARQAARSGADAR